MEETVFGCFGWPTFSTGTERGCNGSCMTSWHEKPATTQLSKKYRVFKRVKTFGKVFHS